MTTTKITVELEGPEEQLRAALDIYEGIAKMSGVSLGEILWNYLRGALTNFEPNASDDMDRIIEARLKSANLTPFNATPTGLWMKKQEEKAKQAQKEGNKTEKPQ